jgi:hypothetical protein
MRGALFMDVMETASMLCPPCTGRVLRYAQKLRPVQAEHAGAIALDNVGLFPFRDVVNALEQVVYNFSWNAGMYPRDADSPPST